MQTDSIDKLKELIKKHEGFRQFPYKDTTGNFTIGYGRCLTTRGIFQTEADKLLDDDINYFINKLSQLFTFNKLNDIRKIVLIDMCFNIGVKGLLNFEKMFDALDIEDYATAAQEMLNSKWHTQVQGRAEELAQMMLTGEFI